MKQETFTRIWGILTIIQIIIYIVCFSHLVTIAQHNTALTDNGIVNTIVLDFLGISMWYLFYHMYSDIGMKWLRVGFMVLSLIIVIGVLRVNIQAVV